MFLIQYLIFHKFQSFLILTLLIVQYFSCFLLEAFVFFKADPYDKQEHDDEDDDDACADVDVLLVRVLFLGHPKKYVFGHSAGLHLAALSLKVPTTPVYVDFQRFLQHFVRSESKNRLFLSQLILVELSWLNSVKEVWACRAV